MTRKTDYPSPEARYEAALEEVKDKLQTGELLAKSTSFERRMVDIPALRKRYGMTQQQFADAFGTLRNWEQGRRIPDGPAQRLLEIIEDRPDVAIEILAERNAPEPARDSSAEGHAGMSVERSARSGQILSKKSRTGTTSAPGMRSLKLSG
jgi:putative transcriptional regulator